MFVRVKSTPNSPRQSVQIVESVRQGEQVKQRIVRHVGIALNDEELAPLRKLATEIMLRLEAERLSEGSLFQTSPQDLSARKRGRPKRVDVTQVAGVDQVRLGDLAEESRRVEGPHEALGGLYDYLGFDTVLRGKRHNALLKDLVLARIMHPGSKASTQRHLQQQWGRSHGLDAIYRMMDQLEQRLPEMKRAVYQATASLTQGQVDLMLFDVTTLYFESVRTDELRRFGYSKDQKYHCTQVVLALATNAEGLPIGYELFAGNTAEVHTLLASVEAWRQGLSIERVTFVADRGLCSRHNLAQLEQAQCQYVVGMPMRRTLKQTQAAEVQQALDFKLQVVDEQPVWVREFEFEGKRLIVTYSASRARKDQADRQAILEKLQSTLGTRANGKKLISNKGYLKYIEAEGQPGTFVLNEDKIAAESLWDGLHAILTNDSETEASVLLARYRRLWVIEESFRIHKHSLAVRPMFHFKPERIQAHIGLCFLAFALLRQAQQRIRLAQSAMSPEAIRDALMGVQASILKHKKTGARYRLPSRFSQAAASVYKALGVKRQLDAEVYLS
jgi:transposase